MPHKDPEAYRLYMIAYRARNAETLRLKKAAYHQANADKICKKSRDWYNSNLERSKARHRTYAKAHSSEAVARVSAWEKANPEKASQHRRRYYETHKAEILKRNRAWQKSHPEQTNANAVIQNQKRRARKKDISINDFTAQQWKTMKLHYGNRCVYCQKKTQRLTMDHITPLSKGGSHTQSNIVPACSSCNSSKYNNSAPIAVQPMLL